MERYKIVMYDESKNKKYIREFILKENKEVVIINTNNEDETAYFDKKLAEFICDFLNEDKEKSKLEFFMEK